MTYPMGCSNQRAPCSVVLYIGLQPSTHAHNLRFLQYSGDYLPVSTQDCLANKRPSPHQERWPVGIPCKTVQWTRASQRYVADDCPTCSAPMRQAVGLGAVALSPTLAQSAAAPQPANPPVATAAAAVQDAKRAASTHELPKRRCW